MKNKRYDGAVIDGQTPDLTFFTECLDVQGFEGLKGIDKRAAGGDLGGAVEQFGAFVRGFLDPHMYDDNLPTPSGANFEPGETLEDAAERIMNHDMISCGVRHAFDRDVVDWEYNPTPDKYREFTWQFQRHHEFKILAYFYRTTGDEKYARCYRELIMTWIMQSAPVPLDVGGGYTNFWRTIECGIRMWDTWPCAIFSFIRSKEITDRDLVNLFKCVYEHGLRLRTRYTVSNWLIMEMNGLIHISLFFPFFKPAKEWEAFAAEILTRQLLEQVYPDGFQQELTTNYHQVVLTNYEGVLRAYAKKGIKPPEELLSALEKMYDVYLHIVMPNMITPNLNDGADLSMSEALGTAVKLLPERQDLLYLQSGRQKGQPPSFTSTMLPYAGYAVMRSDWSEKAIWCFFEDAPLGFGHQHEDKLEVLLYAYGKYMMPEAGRNAYDASLLHQYCLSSQGHNTVIVDGRGQCRRDHYWWDPDELKKKAGLQFKIRDTYEAAEGRYDERYGPECIDVTHARRVLYLKKPEGTRPLIVVIDRMASRDGKEHAYTALWHFDDQKYQNDGHSVTVSYPDGPGIRMAHTLDKTEMVYASENPFQGFKGSEVPGAKIPMPTALCTLKGKNVRFVTVFEPVPDGEFGVESVQASRQAGDSRIVIGLAGGKTLCLDENEYFHF